MNSCACPYAFTRSLTLAFFPVWDLVQWWETLDAKCPQLTSTRFLKPQDFSRKPANLATKQEKKQTEIAGKFIPLGCCQIFYRRVDTSKKRSKKLQEWAVVSTSYLSRQISVCSLRCPRCSSHLARACLARRDSFRPPRLRPWCRQHLKSSRQKDNNAFWMFFFLNSFKRRLFTSIYQIERCHVLVHSVSFLICINRILRNIFFWKVFGLGSSFRKFLYKKNPTQHFEPA